MAGSEDDSPAERSLSASRNLYLVFRADPADRGRGFLAGEARLPTDPMLVSGSWRDLPDKAFRGTCRDTSVSWPATAASY